MSKRDSDDSLEKELDYEDVTIWAGESSKARRELSRMERALYANKSMVLDAAESSRRRRLNPPIQEEESSTHDSNEARSFSSGDFLASAASSSGMQVAESNRSGQGDEASTQFGSGQYEGDAAVEGTQRSNHGSNYGEGSSGQTRDDDDSWPQLSQQQQTTEEENQRQYYTKEAMLNAGHSSRTRRGHGG